MSKLRNVAIVAYAQAPIVAADQHHTSPEMLYPVVKEALRQTGVERDEIDYQCAGSSDYLDGRAFSFTAALDAMGTWPPRQDSHVEMDAIWAAYYSWVRIQAEECDSALITGFGKGSEGSLAHVLNLQLDPFYHSAIGLDPFSTAALQASAYMNRAGVSDADLATIAARNRAAAKRNPDAQVRDGASAAELQKTPWAVQPLRRGYLPPIGESAVAMVIAVEGKAEKMCDKPVWIHGVDHRIDLQTIGARDLTRSESTSLAAKKALAMAGLDSAAKADLIELCATNPAEELIVLESLGLDAKQAIQRAMGSSSSAKGAPGTGGNGFPVINPSGGAIAGNPVMMTGLIRLGEVFRQLSGRAGERSVAGAAKAIAHGSAGHCLQQNIVWVLGNERRWS